MGMNKRINALILVLCFTITGLHLSAQVKYWIKLKDKTGTPYNVSNPGAFLTQKAVDRRTTYNIPVDLSDLPVNPAYISQIEAVANVSVVYASKWLNGVVISVPNKSLALTALSNISNFDFVEDTGRVKRYRSTPDPVEIKPNTEISVERGAPRPATVFDYGGSYWQSKQLNLICLHEQGYRGQGMTIAVMDAGFSNVNTFETFDSIRNNGGIIGTRDFVSGAANAYFGSSHGTSVLSCMAGNKPGRILGSAPMAKYWLLRTEEGGSETLIEEYNWIRGAEFADSVGADILTTSLGYTEFDIPSQNHTYATLNGRTAPMSIAATMAARKGMFVLNAAGNEGAGSWRYISVPGDADSICTVGAVDSLNAVAGFSSVGPTSDGRIKPDLVARGHATWISDGIYDGYPGSGTSFATPVLAGAVACFWQANRSLSNMDVLDSLKKVGSNACNPNNSGGWGIPDLCFVPPTNTITGFVFLRGRSDHSGIKVSYVTDPVNGTVDSTFTNANGSYSIVIQSSTTKITFSKSDFYTLSYNNNKVTPLSRCMTSLASKTLSPVAPPSIPDFDFHAFADPENAQITISLNEAGYDYISVEIFDLLGRRLFAYDPDKTETTIYFNASNLSDEVYLIKVKTSKGTKTKKILKR